MTEDIVQENWVREDGIEYDEQRYDHKNPETCQQCGTALSGGGGRSGYVAWCRECDVRVVIL